jgi:hypothetical protein
MNNQDPQFQEFVQEVAGAIQQNQGPVLNPTRPAQTPHQQPEPIRLTVEGQQYEFANQADLEATLSSTFQQFRGKIEELSQDKAEPQQQQQTEQFDQKQFMDTMAKDPVAAMDYLDKFRNAESEQKVDQLQQQVAQQNYTLAAYEFKERHPEFSANPQGHVILKQIMNQNGWDMNYQNLEAALAIGQMRGMFPTRQQFDAYMAQQAQQAQMTASQEQLPDLTQFQQPQQPQQQYPQQAQNPGVDPAMFQQPMGGPAPAAPQTNPLQQQFAQGGPVAPPPQVPVGNAPGVIPPNFVEQAENMTADQLEQAINAMAQGLPPQG